MNINELIQQGENSAVEFKTADVRPESLAKELVALANNLGGRILVGVDDAGCILGIDRKNFEEWVINIARNNEVPSLAVQVQEHSLFDKRVYEVTVPKGLHKPYQTLDGKYLLRVGSTNRQATKEELSRLFQQAGLVHFDIAPLPRFKEQDLNHAALEQYWDTYYNMNWSRLAPSEKTRILINSDILTPECEVTVGGALLFANNPQKALPHASVVFAVFAGNDKTSDLIDKKEITGSINKQVDNALGLLKLYLQRSSKLDGAVRVEEVLVPEKVLREALVNALVHRDYSIMNQKASVYIFDNRIEITNPGALPNTLTVEKLRYGHSAPRNMFLLKFMDNYRYIDGLGRGIPTMIAAMGERIKFEEVGAAFRVTISLRFRKD
jgi:ATP-dependent DNA helicase RecG